MEKHTHSGGLLKDIASLLEHVKSLLRLSIVMLRIIRKLYQDTWLYYEI